MKIDKFLFGMSILGASMLAACSNDEPSYFDPTDVIDGNGNTFLQISLNSAEGTRAVEDGDFLPGPASEHTVSTASFYFYDLNGNYMVEANVWNSGSDVSNAGSNIEFKSSTVVVLKGLTNKLPSYLVTVLNKPSGFEPGVTLDDMAQKLSAIQNGSGFVMSTSSYNGSLPYNFVTKVNEDNFVKDPSDFAANDIVNIYVERLAAKVKAHINLASTSNQGQFKFEKQLADGSSVFSMQASVAGESNGNADHVSIGTETIYLKVSNWAANATAKNSNLIKKIAPSYVLDFGSLEWNAPSLYRSFWGESVTYNSSNAGDYNYVKVNDIFDATNGGFKSSFGNPWVDAAGAETNYQYITENTHPAGVANGYTTGIVLGAQMFLDADCTKPLDGVEYNGLIFTGDRYKEYILASSGYWYKDGDSYKQVPVSEVSFEETEAGSGEVWVKVNNTLDLYKKDGESFVAASSGAVDTAMQNACKGTVRYNSGYMIYTLPIEHFGAIKGASPASALGYYGVVRNHIYDITINKIVNLGKGVYDPAAETPIVPGTPDPNSDRWMVGASVNILSWKVVNQVSPL